MQIANIARVQGQVVRIVGLTEGDVYKRLVKTYADEHVLKYGVVTGIVTDGETMLVTALEFKPSYSGATIENVTFNGQAEVAILPATKEEWRIHYLELHRAAKKAVEDAENKVSEVSASLQIVEQFTPDKVTFGELGTEFSSAMDISVEA